MAAIDALLRTMLDKGGSDLHLTVGLPAKSRISGSLQVIGDKPLSAQEMEALLKEITPERRWKDFLEKKDLDLAHEVAGLARFKTVGQGDRPFKRPYDITDRQVRRLSREQVSARRAPYAVDQSGLAQAIQYLLQIGN